MQESRDSVVTPTGGINKEWETIRRPEEVGNSEQWNEPSNEQAEVVINAEQVERPW